MGYIFSNLRFYPLSLKSRYIASGCWPDNGVHVSDDEFLKFRSPPNGMALSSDPDGLPCFIEMQKKTTEEMRVYCCSALKLERAARQTSGVVVNGVGMQTDASSIAKMDQYATESMMNGLTVVHWQKADGSFYNWQIADFKKLFSEITKYENDCFGRQSVLLDEINAAADPETVDISTGWPSKTITFV